MVKSVLSVYHQGMRDWIIQRITAIVMGVLSLLLITYFIMHPSLSFAEWHGLFSSTWVKVASMIFLAALVYHAWIGIWTVFTDYVKPFILRSILNFFVLLVLVACFFWGLFILWSI